MIRTFKDKTSKLIFERKGTRWITLRFQEQVLKKLYMLNRASSLGDIYFVPSNRLEKLKGDRADQYSIRVDKKWRICFRWSAGNVYDVELVDYH